LKCIKIRELAAFYGFLKTHSDTLAIQVKKYFEKSDLVALLASLQEATNEKT